MHLYGQFFFRLIVFELRFGKYVGGRRPRSMFAKIAGSFGLSEYACQTRLLS